MLKHIVLLVMMMFSFAAVGEEIGSVSTTFRAFGSNDSIKINVFDDPQVKGVACYLSSAKTGGISGSVGLASDTSDASVACRQSGPISFSDDLKSGMDVFTAKRSLFFKELHVVRFIDRQRKMLVYLTYSDHLVDGSPKNSITAVSYGLPQ